MSDTKVKTDEEYGQQFCVLMNADEELTNFVNYKIAKVLKKFVANTTEFCETPEDYDKVLHSARGELMSLMTWIYGKGRVKENEMNN